jgi:septum formation protein
MQDHASTPRLVLASGSSARLRVLHDAGFDPEVIMSGVDETVATGDTASAVTELAARKGHAVADRLTAGGVLVLACDSLLDVDGVAVGKPANPQAAAACCRSLSGRTAVLYTGHWLGDLRIGRSVAAVEGTVVRFGTMTDDEVDAYVATGEPLHLAGAFSLEGYGGAFIDAVDGSPSNVLGVSLPLVRRMLGELGVHVADLWSVEGRIP